MGRRLCHAGAATRAKDSRFSTCGAGCGGCHLWVREPATRCAPGWRRSRHGDLALNGMPWALGVISFRGSEPSVAMRGWCTVQACVEGCFKEPHWSWLGLQVGVCREDPWRRVRHWGWGRTNVTSEHRRRLQSGWACTDRSLCGAAAESVAAGGDELAGAVSRWVTSYRPAGGAGAEEGPAPRARAMASLLTLLAEACGVVGHTLSPQDVEDRSADVLRDELAELALEEGVVDVFHGRAAKGFRENYAEFWSKLLHEVRIRVRNDCDGRRRRVGVQGGSGDGGGRGSGRLGCGGCGRWCV